MTSIKFYKGAFGASYSFAEGGVYFDTQDHLIKVGTANGVESFAGVRSAEFGTDKILKIVNESGTTISINLSDVASATAVGARLKAIEDDYLKAADKTELAGGISAAASAASAAQDAADAAQDDVDALETFVGSIPTGATSTTIVDYIKEAADAAQSAAEYDDSEVRGLIVANATAISDEAARAASAEEALDGRLDILEGATSVTGSVAYQIAQIVAGADENYDTLKEIADWIKSDSTGAAKMANDIAANASAIDAIEAGYVKSVKASVTGCTLMTVAPTAASNGEVTISIDATELNAAVANAKNGVSASGDDYVVASASNGAVSVSASDSTKASLALADSALQSVSASATGSSYVSATAAAKADGVQAITVSVTMGTMAADKMTVATDGIATVADVANAVAAGISASTLVGASAEDGDIQVSVDNGEISATMSWAVFN